MIFTFYRTIERTENKAIPATVTAKIVATDKDHQATLGTLHFPTQTIWAQFFASLQNGSLRIKELKVVMENATEEDAKVIESVTKPTAVTKTIIGIGIGGKDADGKDTGSDSK